MKNEFKVPLILNDVDAKKQELEIFKEFTIKSIQIKFDSLTHHNCSFFNYIKNEIEKENSSTSSTFFKLFSNLRNYEDVKNTMSKELKDLENKYSKKIHTENKMLEIFYDVYKKLINRATKIDEIFYLKFFFMQINLIHEGHISYRYKNEVSNEKNKIKDKALKRYLDYVESQSPKNQNSNASVYNTSVSNTSVSLGHPIPSKPLHLKFTQETSSEQSPQKKRKLE